MLVNIPCMDPMGIKQFLPVDIQADPWDEERYISLLGLIDPITINENNVGKYTIVHMDRSWVNIRNHSDGISKCSHPSICFVMTSAICFRRDEPHATGA